MSELLYSAGDRWVDMTHLVLQHLSSGRVVMWVSLSGTRLIVAVQDRVITRTRLGAADSVHAFDGWPVMVEPPFFATACGFGDQTGYRSTPPLLVAAIGGHDDGPDEIGRFTRVAARMAHQLLTDGYDATSVPSGHPVEPCAALHCPVRLRG